MPVWTSDMGRSYTGGLERGRTSQPLDNPVNSIDWVWNDDWYGEVWPRSVVLKLQSRDHSGLWIHACPCIAPAPHPWFSIKIFVIKVHDGPAEIVRVESVLLIQRDWEPLAWVKSPQSGYASGWKLVLKEQLSVVHWDSWEGILSRVLQRSVLSLVLFSISITDLDEGYGVWMAPRK